MGKRIDAKAMAAFVIALEGGAKVVEAARQAGVAASSFYRRRKAQPGFADAWDEAVAKSSAPVLIAGANGRRLQKRKTRRVRFTRERKEVFLAHFAGTCDATASAEAAGVCSDTVYNHLQSDAAFAEGWQAALETGYRALEAELVRQQRAAQAAHRPGSGQALRQGSGQAYRIAPDANALAAQAKDFDRSMQLLIQWRKADGTIGKRASPRGDARQRWSFNEAIVLLEKKLAALAKRSKGKAGLHPRAGGGSPRPHAGEG